MIKQINAVGDACPLPVIKTKKALESLVSGTVEVLVDNPIAVQNIEKFAHSAGCSVSITQQEQQFCVRLTKQGDTADLSSAPIEKASASPAPSENFLVVLSSDTMGHGDDALGRILIKGFVFALTQLDVLPKTILLYNAGARLSIQGAETLQDLCTLQQAGVSIYTCGTCLNHFGIAEQLAVGEVTNMYTIVEEMRHADRILQPT